MKHILETALEKGFDPIVPLRTQLEKLGVSLTRINAATREAGELGDENAFRRAVQFEKKAEDTFMEKSLRPWAERHGITIKQAISILSNDSKFNPATRQDDLPSAQEIHGWLDQQNGFFQRISLQKDGLPGMSSERIEAFLSAEYLENPEDALAQMLAKLPPSRAAEALSDAIEKLRSAQTENHRPSPNP